MLIDKLQKRRTQYALGRNITTSADQIDALVRTCIRVSPTAYNCQGSRALVLFGKQSDRLWEIASAVLREIVPAAEFSKTEKRLAGFVAGAGTVLFFEDQQVMRESQQMFAAFSDEFPVWADQSNGMAQLAVWTALAEIGVGASLQHYNPLIDARVSAEWDLPESWKLRAQMPFGSNEASFPEKEFMADELRFRTVGAERFPG